jgi:hypothetical protein
MGLRMETVADGVWMQCPTSLLRMGLYMAPI